MKGSEFRKRLYAERVMRRAKMGDGVASRKPVRRRKEETQIQQAFIAWAQYHPILRQRLYANPNGGYRNVLEAVSLKKSGQKAGVSDLFLAWPCQGLHGLYLETKIPDRKKAKPTELQIAWIVESRAAGYGAEIAYGLEKLKEITTNYLEGKPFTQGDNWL